VERQIMSDWIVWLAITGIVVVMELFTGTFYLLMIAIGLAAGALAALIGWSIEYQLLSAAIIGAIATVSLHRSRFGARHKVSASRDPNVNLDIGQALQIAAWDSHSSDIWRARAMYRGALWDIETRSSIEPLPGSFKIVEIRGSLLIVDAEAA
jgi:membrane protein implicated in regulation of membrane protease activity